MEKFIITRDIIKKNRLFGLTGRTIEFKLKPIPSSVNPVKWVKDAIEEIITESTKGLEPNDQVGFTFCSQDFKRGEGWIRFRPVDSVRFNDVWDLISSIYQSNSSGLNTETFCLGVTSVNMPRGNGRGRRYNNFEEECRMRRGIVTIANRDTLCLPRSLVVAIAFREKDPQYREIRKDIGDIQKTKAMDLMKKANIEIPEGGCGILEIQKFQQYLQDFKIVVYKYGYKGRNIIFSGDNADGKTLNLLYHDGHFNVINSLTAAFCCGYFCEECFVPYDHKNEHRCGCRCPGCFQSPKCQDPNRITCKTCNRSFRGQICYENHLASGSYDKKYAVCEQIKRCNLCLKTIRDDRNHICGEIFCKTCNKHVPDNHLCFIPIDKGSPQSKDTLFIFYDLETRQERINEAGSILHEPNLCVFKQYCYNCMGNDILSCKRCGVRTHILKDKPIERFTEFILNQRKIFKKIIVLAHNGGGFDHQFILNYLLTMTDLTPNLIMRGTKLILMAVDNVKFLDSLNYFPMRLGQLPSAFGLVHLKKGFFPHLFNQLENQNYVGVMPPVEYYDPDNMKTVERDDFLNWYKEKLNENYVFDFQKEFVEYCKDDVEILSQACLKFRQQLIETTNVCPFTEATTIASACNKVYRRNFLKPNTIGIIPKNGYRWRDNQSKYAIQWLIWEEKQRSINIIHTAKQKEAKIAGVKIDGYCQETKQIFEFHGCYFHGCKHCFPTGRVTPLYDNPLETMEHRYEATVSKTERLQNLGYDVIEMWECAFMQLLAENPNIKLCTENNPHLTQVPLIPRDAFYGGRTGNCYEHYKVKADEKIKYIDVCSLYPWVCKYGKFPVGHPTVYVGEECRNVNLQEIDGLLKCTILPPQNLYHPVLPAKMNDKLMFVLCQTCGNNFNNEECCHTKEERSLSGTWVIDEIRMALQRGYEMVEIHEIWKYEEIAQFDRITPTKSGLFTSMMNKFIKIKQEASGWPKNCNTEDEREKFIENFFNIEDVKLEYKNIVENPGLRSLAKLILNSFWGKFGQRENTPKTSIVNKPSDFYKMLVNPALVINSVLPVNEATIIVNWQHIEESYDALSTVNVVIAAFVTAQARLKLYSYLETLGERVLYYDTDSVIYISRPGESDIPTGQCIGDMTDELEEFGQGSYITELVSGGPKNYAFDILSTNTNSRQFICKVKGISLTYRNSKFINFETIKNMILNDDEPIYIMNKNIRRTKVHEVITQEQNKIYRTNSIKRKFFEDHSSVPYGFKKSKNAEF